MTFQALMSERDVDGKVNSAVQSIEDAQLPAGDVLVGIDWAGFNYKDALCLTGTAGLVRNFPHVAGIDFVGRVIESADPRHAVGTAVILTGWRVGEVRWGGFAQRARVEGQWLVPLPKPLSPRDAMVLGTAGLTAMLAIHRLKDNGLTPDQGDVLVTGAGGGVGSLAVMLLGRLGYRVVAVTGRPEVAERLKLLGAAEVIDRKTLLSGSGKVLDKEQFAAAIDPVGGPLLGEVLKKIKRDGAVAAIGNAGGATWEASIIPFILRGVSLFGIDSVMAPIEARLAAWDRLSTLFVPAAYASMVDEISLDAVPAAAQRILQGRVEGKIVVNPRV